MNPCGPIRGPDRSSQNSVVGCIKNVFQNIFRLGPLIFHTGHVLYLRPNQMSVSLLLCSEISSFGAFAAHFLTLKGP